MLRQENIEAASTVTSITPDHNSAIIIAQKNQPESISSELINLGISNTHQKEKNSPNIDDSQSNKLVHSEDDNTVLPSNRADTATRSLSRYIQSHPEGLEQCIAAQRVPDSYRSVEKLHEFLPDCEKFPEPSQNLKVTQRIASIDGKEKHDAFNSRMEEKQPSTTQASAKNSPGSQQQ
ncbi:hypothetical protein O181_047785 [Austropuccinia psidii MF-1]|uniref:Uncharacterized protein n=1 Tax=Austropuccinia psidii MF-1 TaxID=1389203 RepID=A0A9Q3DVZ0_9BASI|nr:hypothetical protein [Austropuccinia psidii MF-1]